METVNSIENTQILVLDDDTSYLNLIKIMLDEIQVKKVIPVTTTQAALQVIQEQTVDLCLLDIKLKNPKFSGIKCAERIRQLFPKLPIIFITNYYTKEYFDLVKHTRPNYFMSKELSRFKLLQVIELTLQGNPSTISKIVDNAQAPTYQQKYIKDNQYFLRVGNGYKAFNLENVAFFFSKDRIIYARIENKNYPTNVQLKVLEKELCPQFVRVHKAFLLNTKFIEHIDTKNGKVIIKKEQIPIGYIYRKSFLTQINLIK